MNPRNFRKKRARSRVEWRAFPDLDLEEEPLVLRFYRATKGRIFTSDNFRDLGLDRTMSNRKKMIGSFFGALKSSGLAMEVGWTRSRIRTNHRRKIREYEWTQEAAEALG